MVRPSIAQVIEAVSRAGRFQDAIFDALQRRQRQGDLVGVLVNEHLERHEDDLDIFPDRPVA